MKVFASLLALLLLCSSCSFFRHTTKDKQTTDSTVHRYDVQVEKQAVDLSFTQKIVVKAKDTVHTIADSLHTDFSYNPFTKDTVRVVVKSGKLRGSLLLHPSTGTGSIEVFKTPEEIPVDNYREETIASTLRSLDTSSHHFGEDKKAGTLDQRTNTQIRNNTVGGLLIFLLFFLVVLYFVYRWLKEHYPHIFS